MKAEYRSATTNKLSTQAQVLLAALFLLIANPLQAQFTAPQQEVHLDYGHQKAQFTFEGDSPIKSADPNCDCASLRIEGNRIIVDVDTRDFDENLNRHIKVRMEDGRKIKLYMIFVVPQPLIISSKSLIWKRNSPLKSQRLSLRIPKGSPISKLIQAGLNGEDFHFDTKTIKKGEQYQIDIRPLSTARKALNRLVLKTDSSDKRSAQYIIYLRIK